MIALLDKNLYEVRLVRDSNITYLNKCLKKKISGFVFFVIKFQIISEYIFILFVSRF